MESRPRANWSSKYKIHYLLTFHRTTLNILNCRNVKFYTDYWYNYLCTEKYEFSKMCGNKIVASCFKTDNKNIHQEVLIRTQGSIFLCCISYPQLQMQLFLRLAVELLYLSCIQHFQFIKIVDLILENLEYLEKHKELIKDYPYNVFW